MENCSLISSSRCPTGVMLTSSEVEDEVDHSFFDSDNDDGSVRREGRETRGIPPVREKLGRQSTEVRARPRGRTPSPTEESDDTVTDVSPLSSPDISSLQLLDLNDKEPEEQSETEQQRREERVPSCGLSDTRQYEDSDECKLRNKTCLLICLAGTMHSNMDTSKSLRLS